MIYNKELVKSPIHIAASCGDLTKLERLINEGVDINSRATLWTGRGLYSCQLTPLMMAAGSTEGATTETLCWLLEHGADLYVTSLAGVTAAWYAAGDGQWWNSDKQYFTFEHVNRLKYLLDAGLNPHECSSDGYSLMTEACRIGDPARVSLLLQRGVNVWPCPEATEKPDYDTIPLFCAVRSGSAECVRLLLQAGADPNTKDDSNCTVLMRAKNYEIAELLIDAGSDINALSDSDNDALQYMLEGGEENCQECLKIANLLLEMGVDIERRDQFGHTRLCCITLYHHRPETVKFLIDHGADAHAKQGADATCLHGACWQSDGSSELQGKNEEVEKIIGILVDAGLDINAPDAEGFTPMHQAAYGDGGSLSAIRALLKHGAEPDPSDKEGITPLMLAAANAEIECIYELLKAGANPTKEDKNCRMAIDYAQKYYESLVEEESQINKDYYNDEDIRVHEETLQRAIKCLKFLQETTKRFE